MQEVCVCVCVCVGGGGGGGGGVNYAVAHISITAFSLESEWVSSNPCQAHHSLIKLLGTALHFNIKWILLY